MDIGNPMPETRTIPFNRSSLLGKELESTANAFALRGARIGFASFNMHNMAVMNIYSQLGARFAAAECVGSGARPNPPPGNIGHERRPA